MPRIFLLSFFVIATNLLNAQNVGIGTGMPTHRLQISGDSALLRVGSTSAVYANKNIISVAGDGAISIDALGVPGGRLFIHGITGNIGIANPAPAYKLDVNGITKTNDLVIANGGSTKDFLIKNNSSGQAGYRKGHGALGLNYIIFVHSSGIFPSQNGGTPPTYSNAIIGEIRLFAGNFAPDGWMLCQGQLLSTAGNMELFYVIGTTYGGNGVNNFTLPDLRGAVPVQSGTSPAGYTWDQGEKSN